MGPGRYRGAVGERDELVERMRASFEPWNAGDIDAIVAGGTADGFGFRTRDARLGFDEDATRAMLTAWYDSLERYRIEDVEADARVDGDTAVVFGSFTEDFRHRGGPPERVRVRYSHVFRRADDDWTLVWQHRDVQDFADDGFYVPRPVEGPGSS